jgi:hypothetical protein
MNERRVSTYHEILELTNICIILRAMKSQQIYIFLVIYACTAYLMQSTTKKQLLHDHPTYFCCTITATLYKYFDISIFTHLNTFPLISNFHYNCLRK